MKHKSQKGFSLIELMVVVAIVGILGSIALPSYRNYVIKASRQAAQTELLELASLQEKIYLNSNGYSSSITSAYNGTSAGGLGVTSGKTKDGKYNLSLPAANQTFTITATPVAGKTQVGDGNISISENGQRLWGTATW